MRYLWPADTRKKLSAVTGSETSNVETGNSGCEPFAPVSIHLGMCMSFFFPLSNALPLKYFPTPLIETIPKVCRKEKPHSFHQGQECGNINQSYFKLKWLRNLRLRKLLACSGAQLKLPRKHSQEKGPLVLCGCVHWMFINDPVPLTLKKRNIAILQPLLSSWK